MDFGIMPSDLQQHKRMNGTKYAINK